MPRDTTPEAVVPPAPETVPAPSRGAALDRIDGPLRAPLRRAGAWSVLSGLMWPVQAAAIAVAVQGWVAGAPLAQGLAMAGLFVVAGVLRALADRHAGGLAFGLADAAVARLRADVLAAEARRPDRVDSSAALAALVAQKLPLLMPYLTRYRIAALRVMVLPVVLVGLAASVSWAVAVVFLLAGPLIPVFMALVGMAARQASEDQMVEIGAMNDLLIDRLAALGDLRLLDATDRAAADLAARADGLRVRTMAVLRVAFLSSAVLELFAAIGVAMVAVYVGFSLLGELDFGAWGTPLTLGEGLFLLLLAPEFFQPLRDLAASWHDRAAAQAVADEVAALTAAPRTEILGDGVAAAALPGPLRLRLRGAVVARGGRRVALPDLDLGPGQAVVLAGPSGSGKSSALAAMAGLLPLEAGTITVTGVALDGASADRWRARIALVPQAVHLPDMDLRGFLDPRGMGVDLGPALAAARAAQVVAGLPAGLDTRLGETGAGVSGGEARRLLIARASVAAGVGDGAAGATGLRGVGTDGASEGPLADGADVGGSGTGGAGPARGGATAATCGNGAGAAHGAADGTGMAGGDVRGAAADAGGGARADLVLADEPTADLDAATAADVIAGLRGLQARGVALVIASHDPAVIAAFGPAVAMEVRS